MAASGRTLHLVGLAAAIMVSVLLAACGDGGDDSEADGAEAPAAAADDAPAIAAAPDEPPEADAGGGDAVAAIEAWAEPLRALGYAITYDAAEPGAAMVANLAIAGPELLSIDWTVAGASRIEAEGDTVTLRPDGEHSLRLGAVGLVFEAESVRVTRAATGDGGESLAFVFSGVTGASGAMESLTAAASLGEDGAEYAFGIDHYLLAEGRAGPLGSTVAAFDTVFGAAPTGITVTSLTIDWGLLQLTGAGELAFDDAGALSGRLDVMVLDVLSVLDAIRASVVLDRNAVAEIYAALLQEMTLAAEAGAPLPLEVMIDGGAITLLGATRGLPDLELGVVAPILVGAAPG
jgi:hypothetical protein